MKNAFATRLSLTAILILNISYFSAHGQESKNVNLSNFNEVHVASGIDLYLTQSSSESIKVTANSDLLNNVLVEKDGSAVSIRYKNNIRWGNMFKGQSIKVYINYKTLQAISASGGSDVYGENKLKTSNLKLNCSGGSDLKLTLDTKNLDISSSGGSDIEVKGNAINLSVSISGGSDLDAYNLKADFARVTASGGSDANVNVSKALEASASGGSDIHYKGDAALKVTSSSKSGEVTKVN